jgi:CDP-glycerol glycerophosphotransferase (TagB/SpsB family)
MKNLDQKQASMKREEYDRSYRLWISSSATDSRTTSQCTGLPRERVVVTGYPRNDYLIHHRYDPDSRIIESFPILRKKIILYAPTWRDNEKVRWLPFDDVSLAKLVEMLEKFDAYLLLRSHIMDDIFRDNNDCKDLYTANERIILANREKFEDVQELLPSVDILISDYSGIWIDYLLLDRPIVLIPYDWGKYSDERGLMYDLNEISPGPMIDSFSDLLKSLEMYLQNPGVDSDRRGKIKKIFHEYTDGKSYERIYNIMLESV